MCKFVSIHNSKCGGEIVKIFSAEELQVVSCWAYACDVEKCSLYIENQVEEIIANSHTRHIECLLLGVASILKFIISFLLTVQF